MSKQHGFAAPCALHCYVAIMSEDQIRVEIADVEGVIENEIKQGLTQKQIAQTYALGLRSSWPTDWAKVNKMIVDRWSAAGLERIKKMAWSGSCFPAT